MGGGRGVLISISFLFHRNSGVKWSFGMINLGVYCRVGELARNSDDVLIKSKGIKRELRFLMWLNGIRNENVSENDAKCDGNFRISI